MLTDRDRDRLRDLQDELIRVAESRDIRERDHVVTHPQPITLADFRTTIYPALEPEFWYLLDVVRPVSATTLRRRYA